MDRYYAVRVTRTRIDTTIVHVKLGEMPEAPPTDVAKDFLKCLWAKRPVDYENKFADVQTTLEAYERADVREVDATAVDVTV